MLKTLVIAQKEFLGQLKTPTAYLVLIIALSVFNLFFFVIVDTNQEASLRDVFKAMEFIFLFIVPLLTMKSFSKEKEAGTLEFLMTTPTSNTAIVLGKYLGALAFFSLIILATGTYYLIIQWFGSPDAAAVGTGYFGIFLEGAFFIAIGVLVSSLTSSQMVAAMCSYAVLFVLYFSSALLAYVPSSMAELVGYAGTLTHSGNFFVGVMSTADLVYYVSGIIFCLGMTRVAIENRIWR